MKTYKKVLLVFGLICLFFVGLVGYGIYWAFYWNYREETANIHWLDHETVEINGHILVIPHDKFDYRRQK
ncbi:DUF5412 family protein [Bacillus niameyensis]|uniref:DUF5412 family protein n=1 Tax=Bacillus niameyensis TaxID=1522308 RepID=UPI0007841C29|nr:DUF5412 family protein [Bacillus niameyensis]